MKPAIPNVIHYLLLMLLWIPPVSVFAGAGEAVLKLLVWEETMEGIPMGKGDN